MALAVVAAAVVVAALALRLVLRRRRASTPTVEPAVDVVTPARGSDPSGRVAERQLIAGSRLVEPCARPDGFWMRLYARWCGVDSRKAQIALAHREQVPILACVGANGGGKTLAAVYTVLPTLRGRHWTCANADHLHVHGAGCAARRLLSSEPRIVCDCATTWEADDDTGHMVVTGVAAGGATGGLRRVLSTVALYDPASVEAGRPVLSPVYEPLRSFQQLLGCEHADVVMDEVTGVASARTSQSLPPQVENLVVQLRRRDARLIWTTPDYGAADVRIRQVTQGVVHCSGFAAVESTAPGRVWLEARMFRWSLYDSKDFDQFTAGKREKLRPRSTQWLYRPGHIVQDCYDTSAAVAQLGAAAEGGMCMACGGSRSRPKCTCPTDPERLAPGIVEVVTESGIRRRQRVEAAS